jgi:rfaE bifunctional protein nucleotidyltransferase chain/domain
LNDHANPPADESPLSSVRGKIKSIADLAPILEETRQAGHTVALAHGTFDLVHMGHVRHLESARQTADVLVVTLTADRFVNKGPGRPIFSQALRAEMLAALAYVDWVAISEGPTAEPIIRALKPDVYVKGSDYANAEDDVTGKIVDEREAVEAHGGRIAFTDEIVFSSSELINRHLTLFDPKVRGYLDEVRNGIGLSGLLGLIEAISDMKVLLVGDTIIDEYRYVKPYGQASKEHIIATQFRGAERFAGGVIAAANHVSGFCGQVDVITVLGSPESDEEFIRSSLRDGVNLKVVYRENAPTICKTRFVEEDYLRKLFEVQSLDDTPMEAGLQATLDDQIAEIAGDYDLVIVTDFGHGMIARSTIDVILENAKFTAVNAQSNSANRGFNLITKYPRADYICIDSPEAQFAVGEKFADLKEIAVEHLAPRIDCDRFILTQGKHGCVTYDKRVGVSEIPAITDQVVDTIGAGDAFFVVTAPMVAKGAALEHVGLIGNVVGAIKVGILGHRASVEKVATIKALTGLLK